MIENIVIIGAGNLATQLAQAMTRKGIQVKQVYSRTIGAAKELAGKVNADFTNDLSCLMADVDLYIISVKDPAIEDVASSLQIDNKCLVVHTAGSIPMEVLSNYTPNCGVFYPLQTFSKDRNVDFSSIPICLEANHLSDLLKLQELGQRISSSVHLINSGERKALHLAAVFANNFVNHFYTIAAEVLKEKNLDFNLLKPLIRETAEKIKFMDPIDAQTGPARRNDQSVIHDQLNMLRDQPDFQKLYNFVSQSICQFHQKHNHDLL